MKLHLVFVFSAVLFSFVGCGWMTPPRQTPSEVVSVPPPAPQFLSLIVKSSDSLALAQMKVIEISDVGPTNSVWLIDDHTIGVRKLADGEKVYFAVDFGMSDMQDAQFELSKDSSCPGGENYRLTSNDNGFTSTTVCGPATAESLSGMGFLGGHSYVTISF